jgi:beta-N-acetylglucosaminidase
MKKHIQALTFAAGVTLLIPTTAGAAKDDITGHWAEDYIRNLASLQIMIGDGKGTFSPDNNISRGEFATLISNALKLPNNTSTFKDIDAAGAWFVPGIQKAAGAGIISGYGNGMFGPKDSITRDQAVTMIDKALKYKGIQATEVKVPFTDLANALNPDAIARVYGLGIVSGKGGATFAPKGEATRAEVAVMLTKMLKVINTEYTLYQDGVKGKVYKFKDEAIAEAKRSGADAVKYEDTHVWTRELAFTNSVAFIYKDEKFSSSYTSVSKGTELAVLDVNGDSVQVQLFDTIGYVKKSQVNIVPAGEMSRSYYEVKKGGKEIIHHIYNGDKYDPYLYGKVPNSLTNAKENVYINSLDDKVLGDEAYYHYFNRLSGRSKTDYTGEDFDNYLRKTKSDSPMIGLGNKFKEVEAKYNVNALMLFAMAAHETGFGTSKIAKEKNNLFGLNATDDNPGENAMSFSSKEESIEQAAKVFMNEKYLNASGGFVYNGGYVGNKSHGINVRYATDAYWGQKVAAHMYIIDRDLGRKDINRYEMGVVKADTKVQVGGTSYTLKKGTVVTITKNTGTSVSIFADVPGGAEATLPISAIEIVRAY